MKTLVLSKTDIETILTYESAIENVEYVFREWGRGNVVMPAKINLNMSRSGYDSWANAMPAFVVPLKAAGIKWIGGYADNARNNLPFIMGAILLSDPQTGAVLAVMDGSHITNLRTGASAAVCAKYLAAPKSARVAIVGGGVQGQTALKAMSCLYKNMRVKVAEISVEKRRKFCETMQAETGLDVSEAETVAEAVADADIIVLVTTAKQPIVKNEWIKNGALVLAMGSFQQVEDEFALSAGRIVVDSFEQASHRGEIKHLFETGKITKDDIYAELGEIVAGKKKGRDSNQERILMIPVGLGAHDICIAHHLYQSAMEKQIGVFVELY
ncbi:MAG: ornithine cyclodeaminase family protein [Kiritimatiellia bacterium]|nr:ornithine cyclodeaminase family protein [Kiritimatiellia bacterium]